MGWGRGVVRPVAASLLVVALLEVAPGVALAEGPADAAMAQSLFDAGRQLMNEGKYAEACAKLEESNRLDPSAGTLLNLAKCLESQGKSASAWAMYKRTIAFGRTTGQQRQVAAAEEFVAQIEPKLTRLVVIVEAPVPGLRLRRGEVELGDAVQGTPFAVDPGSHTVSAEAPGYEAWSTTVEVSEEGATTEVRVPALVAKRRVEPPPAPPAPPSPPPPEGIDPLLVGGLVVGGVGLVGLGLGAAFGVMTLSDASAAEQDPALCPDKRCTPEGLAAIDDARTKATVSTVGFVAGGVALAGGAALVAISLLSPSDTSAPAVAFAPMVDAGTLGLLVGGAW